jgi:hypothetical protein
VTNDPLDHPIAQPGIDPRRVPFERTAAFRKYGTVLEPAPG